MSKKLVLSISGGMDSVVLLHMAVDRGFEEIHLITYNYGQRHVISFAIPLMLKQSGRFGVIDK